MQGVKIRYCVNNWRSARSAWRLAFSKVSLSTAVFRCAFCLPVTAGGIATNRACTRKKHQVARNTLPERVIAQTVAEILKVLSPRSISAGNTPE